MFDYLIHEMKNCSPDLIGAQLLNLKNGADDQISQISKHLNRFWRAPKSIVTYSRSSVVVSILKGRKNRVKSVLLSTAAPGNEGVTTARELTALGITTTLCTDAALPGLIRSDHIVLLGADRVGQKQFVNKTGTFPLLLAAREVGAKSFLLFESFKKTTGVNPKFNPTNMVKTEIIPDARSKIEVVNYYFEEIDLRFVDHLISG